MKKLVLYKSKTGFVKRYAEIIAESCEAEICEFSKFDKKSISEYDVVIYGGGLYAIGINGLKKFKNLIQSTSGSQKIVVFASGASPGRESDITQVKKHNFDDGDLERISFFYLRGGFNFNKLNFFFRIMMKMYKSKMQSKKTLSREEKAFIDSFDYPVDYVSKENAQELIDFVNKM